MKNWRYRVIQYENDGDLLGWRDYYIIVLDLLNRFVINSYPVGFLWHNEAKKGLTTIVCVVLLIVYIIHMVFALDSIFSSRQHAFLNCFYTYLTLGSTLKCNVNSRFIKPGWLYIYIHTYVYEKGAASEIMRRETHLKQIPNNYTKLVLNLKHSIFSQFHQYIICSGLFASWYF